MKHVKAVHEDVKLFCYFYNNNEECPHGDEKFLYEDSEPCKYGKQCAQNLCMFKRAENDENEIDKSDSDGEHSDSDDDEADIDESNETF